MISSLAFYALASILVLSSLAVVLRRNIFVCGLYLAIALSAVAGIFVLLGADFLASAQILVYVGGILVVILFAIMLSSVQQSLTQPQLSFRYLPALFLSAIIVASVYFGLKKFPFSPSSMPLVYKPTTEALGHLLLKQMALPFELISLVLLAALAGAILFTKREDRS